MKKQILTLIILISSLGWASAGTETKSQSEVQTHFPQQAKFYLRPVGPRWESGFISDNKRQALLTSDSVLSIPQFNETVSQGPKAWGHVPIFDKDSNPYALK